MTDSVRVEMPNVADLATKIATPLLFPTMRLGLEVLIRAGSVLPINPMHYFRVTRMIDAPAAVLAPEPGTHRKLVRFENFRGEWLWNDDTAEALETKDAAIMYMHGGAFLTGGLNTHRRMVARIGKAGQLPVFNVDYRQLPDAHLTDSLEDAVEAYLYLLDEGFPAERIVLAGDSAGAGLSFLLALALRDRGLPLPAAIAAIAPWADLDNANRLAHPNVWRDPMIPAQGLGVVAGWGFAIEGRMHPSWSPVNHDFAGLPPVLIQVGSTEILQADAEQLTQRCYEAGVECTLQVWDRAPHVFQLAADLLPDAQDAIRHIGTFMRRLVPAIPSRRREAVSLVA